MNATKSPLRFGDEPMRTSGSWAKSNDRVLVIADSEEMREQLAAILSQEGFVVFEQPSAIGATRSIRQNGIRAVVVDVTVPGFRGEKLVSVMRENPRLDGLVIVVVTDETAEQGSVKGLEAVDAVLDRSGIEFRLVPLLGRLLRNSNFRPQDSFSASGNKS
jgi:DNA-binding response OmpR family regulator